MNIRLRKILGKIFLSSTAFLWFGCDNDTASDPKDSPTEPTPFIDIEQELSKISQPDTTGLRGKCISAYSFCETIEDFNAYYYNRQWASSIAQEKIDSLLNAPQSSLFSSIKKSCYKDLIELEFMPEYGVSPCYDVLEIEAFEPSTHEDSVFIEEHKARYEAYLKKYNLTECESGSVVVGDKYIEAILENDQYERSIIQSRLEEINEKAAACDNLEEDDVL